MIARNNRKFKNLVKNHDAVLIIENGKVFWGYGIGFKGQSLGEICFNTSMTGYQEIITDPSYANQIINFTFPHIGIVGTNLNDNESKIPVASGIIVKEISNFASNYRSDKNFNTWLKEKQVIGIQGIDTRAITSMIRNEGFLNGMIINDDIKDNTISDALNKIRSWKGINNIDLASKISTKIKYNWSEKTYKLSKNKHEASNKDNKEKKRTIIVIDYGVKHNILRMLAERNFNVTVVPSNTSYKNIMKHKPAGVFLSNGPGDPYATSKHSTPILKQLFNANIPIFGICLGHQLLALALGAATEKMNKGHRGANQPVQNIKNKKVEITSQNHGFVVKRSSLNKNILETHTSLFDGVIEGLEIKNKNIFSVQYHPEASPGPQDTNSFFDEFLSSILENEQNAKT